MKTINRASGVQITIPSKYNIAETVSPTSSKRRSGPGRVFGPIPLPKNRGEAGAVNDVVVAAFGGQEMQLVDQVEIIPPPAVTSTTRKKGVRSSAAAKNVTDFKLALAPNEDAVVLLEQDGMYSWQFANEIKSKKARSAKRGVPAVDAQRLVQFRITLDMEPSTNDRSTRRGILEDFALDKVKAFIFKFAARVAVGQAMKYLERNVRRGLVNMTDVEDPAKWELVTNPSTLKLPKNRPARILLFIHGTFSSTIGGYGPLTTTPWGRKFLQTAQSNYDAVIGFDHATLSDDPLENATDLLNRLQMIDWTYTPRFDIITHSRGGLVARSLMEHLLPLSKFKAVIERVIFVAVTNGGTKLAEPENWQTLIDMYTNISVAACRLIGMIPQAKPVTTIFNEIVKSIGALVKYSATTAINDRNIPGLAAMEPDGKFISNLNLEQPAQPSIDKSYYCAVTSDFKPNLLDNDHEPKELPQRFLLWAAKVLAGQLMKEPNDLVVNTASMTNVDPQIGKYMKDSLDFGSNPLVYHTNYFIQPEVVNAFARWLSLTEEVKTSPTRRRSKSKDEEKPKPDLVIDGGMARIDVPAIVDTDIFITNAMMPLLETVKAIQKESPSYVVIRRDYQGGTLDYAFAAEDIMEMSGGQSGQTPLLHALNLHETDRSNTVSITDVMKLMGITEGTATSRREVVLSGEQPVGVLRDEIKPSSGITLAGFAGIVSEPRTDAELIQTRRIMPSFAKPGGFMHMGSQPGGYAAPSRRGQRAKPPITSDAKAPTTITCHFRAEMDQEIIVKRTTTIEVMISREIIGQLINAVAAEEQAEIDPSRKLFIQVLPKVNLESVDEGWTEIDAPQPASPQRLYFIVKATDLGEGEIWVIARQGQVPLVTLILKPEIVKARGEANHRAVAQATTPEAPKLASPLHQLLISEQRNGGQLTYKFHLQSPDLKLLEFGESKPIIGDRTKYVAKLYEEIENRWLGNKDDVKNFTEELRALGAAMFDELIPPNIQKALWKYRKQIKSIMVIAEEPFIPWEIVHLKQPEKPLSGDVQFLGQMGLVRWLQDAGWPPDKLSIQKGNARYVIPQYPHPDYVLPQAEQEAKFLEKKFAATAVEPSSGAVRELISKPDSFGLLHFACHGAADQDNIANAQLILQGRVNGQDYIPDFLSATTVEQNANLSEGGNAPLIVLNACQTGRAGYKLTGIGGFAQAFLKRKAGAFVGTLWSVGDVPARTFTEEFYTQLIKGSTIAEATIKAREKAQKAGDATWLAYVVYGHPHARIK